MYIWLRDSPFAAVALASGFTLHPRTVYKTTWLQDSPFAAVALASGFTIHLHILTTHTCNATYFIALVQLVKAAPIVKIIFAQAAGYDSTPATEC